jgi:hypothetical protein
MERRTKVEHHVNALNGDGGIDNDLFTRLLIGANYHLSAAILVCNERSDVGLDASSTDADNNDGCNEAAETSSLLESARDGGGDQDEETGYVDEREDENGVVFSKVLVCNDGSEDGCHWQPC